MMAQCEYSLQIESYPETMSWHAAAHVFNLVLSYSSLPTGSLLEIEHYHHYCQTFEMCERIGITPPTQCQQSY